MEGKAAALQTRHQHQIIPLPSQDIQSKPSNEPTLGKFHEMMNYTVKLYR